MADVVRKFDTLLRGRDGRAYEVQASGRERPDHLWEGWLEFIAQDGGEPVISPRETVQPNRDDLVYWAGGLTDPYLDGALHRALAPAPRIPVPDTATAVADGPSERRVPPSGPERAHRPTAVLDPFHVYAEGDDILRGQLDALSATQLRNIVRAHDLSDMRLHDLERTGKPELKRIIMAAVERAADPS